MKISEIKPYSKNAKKHPKKQVEQVANSIKEFGFNQPVVIDKNNVIIVGHGRLEAAKLLGLGDVPVIKLDLTDEQAKAYRLADNKLNESNWDMELVIEELKGLSPIMLDLTGFNADLIIDKDNKDDVVPENVPAQSKLGDLYELGPHRLLCGDSTKPEEVDRLMNGHKADMVFTDPPYNVDYTGMQNSKQWANIANDAMTAEEFEKFLRSVFNNYNRVTKGEAALYICHADKSHKEFRNAFEQEGFEWRATIIWVKNSPAFNFAQYKYKHEPIFYCFKKGNTVKWFGDLTNNTIWKEEWDDAKIVKWHKDQAIKNADTTTIWEAKKEHGLHPTIKPVELIQKAIFNSSQKDDLVLDLFGGSGSTLIASEKMGRVCNTMEYSPTYVDVIVQRYVDYTGNEEIIKNGEKITWQELPKI